MRDAELVVCEGDAELEPPRVPPLWLFFCLMLPYGIAGGITGAVLAFLLRQEGVSLGNIANELTILGVPSILYFLWSPIADSWLRLRSWILVACSLTALVTYLAFQFHSLASPIVVFLLTLGTCTITVSNSAYGGLVAALVPEDRKTRVASFAQMGNLGGGALGSAGLLFLAPHVGRPTLGLAAALMIFLPSLAALFLHEPPPRRSSGLIPRLREIGTEIRETFLRWRALPALLLLVSPLGSGGAVGLLAGLAQDFHVSENQVAWMNGIAGGLLTAAGALLAVAIPGRLDRRLVYTLVGIVNAAVFSILVFGPMRASTYLAGATLYLFTVGTCWAVYSALCWQVVGAAGTSGSCRSSIANGIGSAPVAYMGWLDGRGAVAFGPRGLPGIDVAFSFLTGAAFLLWLWLRRPARTTLAGSPAIPSADLPEPT